jgi:Ca2+-binding EF-hand superfamily protein
MALEDVSSNVRTHSLAEAEALTASQEAFTAQVETINGQVEALSAQQEELTNEGVTENVYTAYTYDEVKEQLTQLETALSTRQETIVAEVERQTQNETLKVAFADAANPFAAHVEGEREGVDADTSVGSLEDQKAALEARSAATEEKQADFDVVEQANAALEEALVFNNEHTTVAMDALAHDWEALKNMISKAISENANQIEQRDSLGITDEEVADLKKTFDHFDKDKSGALDRLEFRACLMAAEVNLPTLENSSDPDPKFDAIMAECASTEDNCVQLPDFIAYMARQSKDKDTPEQLLESMRVLAGGKDTITEAALSAEFSPEDVADIISKMAPTDVEGEYDYKPFVESIFGASE